MRPAPLPRGGVPGGGRLREAERGLWTAFALPGHRPGVSHTPAEVSRKPVTPAPSAAQVHAYIISSLKKEMPNVFGKESKKKELVNNLGEIYAKIEREHQISAGDFPSLRKMQVRWPHPKRAGGHEEGQGTGSLWGGGSQNGSSWVSQHPPPKSEKLTQVLRERGMGPGTLASSQFILAIALPGRDSFPFQVTNWGARAQWG